MGRFDRYRSIIIIILIFDLYMSRQDYIQATNKAGFEKALKEGKISEEQIGFIEEEDLIWAKGNYYGAVPDNEDLTKDKDGKLQFSDRSYNPANFSGKGYKILRKNIVQERNVLTQEMMVEPNTIYEIRYDFDLSGETINVPEGCVLKFEGGSLKNGTLNGNGTIINSNNTNIFKDIDLKNKFISETGVLISWWIKDNIADNTEDVQRAFNSILSFDCKKLIIDKPIIIKDISFVNKYNPNIIITGDLNSNKQHLYDIKVIGESSQGIDISGTTGLVFKDLTFFGSDDTESFQNAPRCILYMSRTQTNNSGGNHSFYNVSFRGYSTVSHIYNYAAETNKCIDCKFINDNNTNSMNQLVYYTSINSLGLKSKFDDSISPVNPCTDSRFLRCSLSAYNNTRGLYIEGSPTSGINKNNVISINIDNCYFYLQTGISAEFKDIQGSLNVRNCIDEGGSQISTKGNPLFKLSSSEDNYNIRNVCFIGNTFYPRENSDIINTVGTVLKGFTALSNYVFGKYGVWRFGTVNGGYMTFSNIGNEKILVENYSTDFEVKTSNIESIKDNIILNNKDYLYYARKDLNPTDVGVQRYYRQDIYVDDNHQADMPCWWDGKHWKNSLGKTVSKNYGATVERLTPELDEDTGWMFANTEFNRIEYYMKGKWIDSQGNPADALKKGTTSQRPTGVQPGFHYFDTDLGHDMVWDGQEWYDPTNKDEFSDLYKIMYNQHASVSVSSNVPGNIIEKGVPKAVTLSWNYIFNGASTTPDTLQLKSGQDVLVGDKGTKTYTDNIQDTKTYQVVSIMKGVTKTAGITINAYYPIYYGGSSKTTLTSDDVLAFTKHGSIKSNPSGSYNFQVDAGEYAWICVPAGMVINKVTSNGFGVPIEPLATVAVTGKGNYNCYRSSETFTSGMFSCVVG